MSQLVPHSPATNAHTIQRITLKRWPTKLEAPLATISIRQLPRLEFLTTMNERKALVRNLRQSKQRQEERCCESAEEHHR